MGFLRDIRSRKRTFSLGAIVFWTLIGGGLGTLPGNLFDDAVIVLGPLGCLIGFILGFYAAFGASRVARRLAAPGAILDFFMGTMTR